MKKLELKYWAIWFLFLLILVGMTSCGSTRQTPQPTTVENNNTVDNTIKSDTLETKIVERPGLEIENTKPIPEIKTGNKNCDSICNAEKDKIFESLNSKVKAGKNELGFVYNKLDKTLTAYGKLQASFDSVTKQKKSFIRYITITKEKTITITKEKQLSKEQKFNLWTGRIFWVLLFLFLGWRFSRIFT